MRCLWLLCHVLPVDPLRSALYIHCMEKNSQNEELELKQLESRIEELIATCDALKKENHTLRQQQSGLVTERARLIEKTEMARNRVEAMISRLKSMETGYE